MREDYYDEDSGWDIEGMRSASPFTRPSRSHKITCVIASRACNHLDGVCTLT